MASALQRGVISASAVAAAIVEGSVVRRVIAVSIGWLGLSMVSDGVPALLLPHQLLAGGMDRAATLGLITLAAIGAAALVQPAAGALSDRIGRFPVIGMGVLICVTGLALLVAPNGVIPGTVLALVGAGVAQAGHQALLPDELPTEWRGRGAGAKGMLDVGGAFLGFVILGALLGAGDAPLAVAVLGAAMTLAFLVALFLLPTGWRRRAWTRRSPPGTATGRAGVRAVFRVDRGANPGLLRLVLARFTFLLGIYAVGRFLLLFVSDRLGLDPATATAQTGGILALLALVTLAASLPSGWLADRAGRRPMMLLGGVLAAIGIGLLPLATSLPGILGLGVLMAIGSAAFGSGSWALLTDVVRPQESGRLMGIAHFGTAGAAALAGGFGLAIDAGNALGPQLGFTLAFGVAALMSLAGGVAGARLPRQIVQPMASGSAQTAVSPAAAEATAGEVAR